ncbi:phytanoyl-CoA dioxygenase family protein [Rhodococcus koreensis]
MASSTMKPSGVDETEILKFHNEGFLVVEDIIDVEEYLDPMVRDFDARLTELCADLFAKGEISSMWEDEPFQYRLTHLYQETGKSWAQYFDCSLPLRRQTAADEPCFFPPSVFNLLRHPGVLDVVEAIIGSEITSNPVQHVRLKPPHVVAAKALNGHDSHPGAILASPWHQDASVVMEEADDTEMITVWVPIFDAADEDGCLQIAPRSHTDGLLEHCPAPSGRYLSTARFDVDRAIPVPMRRGSALFMTRMTPHSSLENVSDKVRWSMDLRYNETGRPTGRPEFPEFIARSRRNPESELRDPALWEQSWMRTRAELAAATEAGKFARSWTGDGCA